MTKGIVYYTHGKCDPVILDACRRQIDRAAPDLPVVNVSLTPLPWRTNIVLDEDPGILTMFKQQLAGLQAIDTDVVFFCEHDVLYHPSHFTFTPPRENVYYFNLNVWAVDPADGKSLYYDGMKMTSGLCASRAILIEHYTKKIAWVEEVGKFHHNLMGFEPGCKPSKGRTGDYAWDTWRSEQPNVDIKHGENLTKKRFAIDQYRSRRLLKTSWRLEGAVPGWGVTKQRFPDFLQEAVA